MSKLINIGFRNWDTLNLIFWFQSVTPVTAEQDQSCLVKDKFSEMWCFKEFTFPFFFTSVWTLLGTKVEAFAPLPPINLLLHQLLTGHNPQIPQMLRVGGPAGIWASRSDSQPVESWDWGQRQRESYLKNKKNNNNLTSPLYNWRTLGTNMHVGSDTGTVLHSDVCRWGLRWQCALSKESLPCSVNGAGSGRLAINPKRIEDSNLPLTAAVIWSDLWRPANYLSK